jgi:hypothetical protein
MNTNRDLKKRPQRKYGLGGWTFVIGLAILFLLYGLFVFFSIGDKGPADWDFGAIEDIPGKSVYSTSPEPSGNVGEPEPQHVAGRPSSAGVTGEAGTK